MAPLMLKIIWNIFFLFAFSFKTLNSLYVLIDGSLTDWLKRFLFCCIIAIVLIALRQK